MDKATSPNGSAPISQAADYYVTTLDLPLGAVHGCDASGRCGCADDSCESPRKHPVGGHNNWTRKPEKITELLAAAPDRGLFLSLEPAGLVDLDLDVRSRGDYRPGLAQLESDHGPLPPTWTLTTPTGGQHRLYQAPSSGTLRTNLAPRVELRSKGSAPLPPSKHYTGGSYDWEDDHAPWDIPLAELPPAWIEFASGPDPKTNGHRAEPLPEVVGEGERHKLLLSLAGTLRQRGLGEAQIANQLRAFNTEHCQPSLPDADCEALARDVARRYPPGKRISVLTSSRNTEPETEVPENPREVKEPRFKATKPDTSTFQAVRWAWSGMVPLGKLSMLVGEEGIGKGTLLAYLAAHWSCGLLDGDLRGDPAMVLFLADEDGFEDTIGPRLLAAGADFDFIRHIEPRTQDDDPLVIPGDVDELRRLIRETEAKVVIVDPLDEFTDAGVDSWKSKAVRHALAPARQVAHDTNCALLAVKHLNKGKSSNIRDRISDSHAYNALSRSTLLVATDHEDPDSDRRFVAARKQNLAKSAPVLEFRIVERIVRPRGMPISVPRVDDLKASDREPADLLERKSAASKIEKCAQAIRELLADGEQLGANVKATLLGADFSMRTIQRASSEIVGVIFEDRDFPRQTYWRLPIDGEKFTRTVAPTDEGATAHEHLGATGEGTESPANEHTSEPAMSQPRHLEYMARQMAPQALRPRPRPPRQA